MVLVEAARNNLFLAVLRLNTSQSSDVFKPLFSTVKTFRGTRQFTRTVKSTARLLHAKSTDSFIYQAEYQGDEK